VYSPVWEALEEWGLLEWSCERVAKHQVSRKISRSGERNASSD
jgi:hypothetical protein